MGWWDKQFRRWRKRSQVEAVQLSLPLAVAEALSELFLGCSVFSEEFLAAFAGVAADELLHEALL